MTTKCDWQNSDNLPKDFDRQNSLAATVVVCDIAVRVLIWLKGGNGLKIGVFRADNQPTASPLIPHTVVSGYLQLQ